MTDQTQATKAKDIIRKWYLFDVKDQTLGRISTQIALALSGKSKTNFVHTLDCGDHVVVINAGKVVVTGKKEKKKLYGNYSGHPGGFKQKPLWQIRQEKPTELIRHAVYGMIAKNKLRDRLMTRLYIFADDKHPYTKEIENK